MLIDGLSDTGLEKTNLITVRIFDTGHDKVDNQFLHTCTTTGATAATMEMIFGILYAIIMGLASINSLQKCTCYT